MEREKLFWFRVIAQIGLGLTFVVSGILKTLDIYGTELKLIEYGNIPGLDFLGEYNMLLAAVLCAFEIFLGLWVMIFVYRKISLSIVIVTTLLFTGGIICLMLNPEMNISDCGCFGDILPMSMTVSLVKNIIIIALAGFLLWCVKGQSMFVHKDITVLVLLCFLASLLLPVYAVDKLSIYNPTGYGEGSDLKTKNEFVLFDENFEDVKDSLLNATGKVYVIVLKHKPSEMEEFRIRMTIRDCEEGNASCFAIAAEEYKLPDGIKLYHSDAVLLKSLVRSQENGKLTLINGVIDNVEKLYDF